MERDYNQDLHIDENALDIEWLEQPKLMFEYTGLSAKANRALEKAKEKLDVVRAEIDLDIRKNPDDYGIEKVTEATVQHVILLEDQYQEAFDVVSDARYEVEMMKGAVRSVEHRKDALENMSRLLGLQYFAGPRTPRDLTTESAKKARSKKVNAGIKIGRRKD